MQVALTFDDGPAEWTAPILDLLAAHSSRASFFVCGHAVEANARLLRRMAAEGHEIGNHTFSHPRLTGCDDAEVSEQLERTQALLEEHANVAPDYWRAPHFDHNLRVDAIARGMGLEHVGCTIDPGDWGFGKQAESLANVVEGFLTDGSIVDLHDGIPPGGGNGSNTRQATVDAVALLLLLRLDGVEFVTVADL